MKLGKSLCGIFKQSISLRPEEVSIQFLVVLRAYLVPLCVDLSEWARGIYRRPDRWGLIKILDSSSNIVRTIKKCCFYLSLRVSVGP